MNFIDAEAVLLLGTVCLWHIAVSHLERKNAAAERARLIAAALATTPQQAAAAVQPPVEPAERPAPRLVQAF